jgi:hypothetical protein
MRVLVLAVLLCSLASGDLEYTKARVVFTSLRVLGIALSCIGFGPPALIMLAVSARRRNWF